MRIIAQPAGGIGDADTLEQPRGFGERRRAVHAAMELQGLAELLADAIDRVEAARRVLEDHRDPRAADGFEITGRRAHQVAALEQDLAADAGAVAEQAEGGKPGHALA